MLIVSIEWSVADGFVLLTRHHPNGVGSATRPLRPGQRFELEVVDGEVHARVIEPESKYVEVFLP